MSIYDRSTSAGGRFRAERQANRHLRPSTVKVTKMRPEQQAEMQARAAQVEAEQKESAVAHARWQDSGRQTHTRQVRYYGPATGRMGSRGTQRNAMLENPN